jgi:hypothetical protein
MLAKEDRTLKPHGTGRRSAHGQGSETSHLVLFPGALGDAVCLEPAVAYLARSGPVTIHARDGAAEVAALFPSRPRVRSIDAIEVARLFSPEHDIRTDAWLAGYARIVSFTGARVTHVRQRLVASGRAVCAPFPRLPLDVHASDYFLRLASGDPSALAPVPRLALEHAVHRSGGRLALLPGSGGPAKRAPAEFFAAIARRWQRAGGDVVVVLGPAEGGEDAAWRDVGRVLRPDSVAALAGWLAAAAAFVGNDAGPSHVAAALGLAGVVLYAETGPESFGPRGDDVYPVHRAHGDDARALAAAWRALSSHLP